MSIWCRNGVVPILFWWFMTASALPAGASVITTHGPFVTRAECEQAAKWARAMTNNPKSHPLSVYPCWSDGR